MSCWKLIKQSQAFKCAQTMNNSMPAQRIKATLIFVLYIFDMISDILVGYDLYQKCHIMYSLFAFMILSLPGISEGLIMMKYGSVCKNLFAPIWFLPAVGWRLFKNIIYLDDEANKCETLR